ncbi:DNA methyltransferase [Chlorobaculum sp. 24CR]|uniref:DNA methyltransferase n=1 Tax=Chlorobaculum sp. 24CR TaxID=2508878 RepID=UPI00100AD8D9|nr:DNA methyltransferase [Chlorobaculum sp. 24CR]RXK87779.1 DNA methyltransferase [Chlorobaculum sp. 24CR]
MATHNALKKRDILHYQQELFSANKRAVAPKKNSLANKLDQNDRAFHDWYRFVLSFPPHLVRDYIARFSLTPGQTLLDPFCGTGTTLVEAKKQGIHTIGIEANPVAHFASSVKVNWQVDSGKFLEHAEIIAEKAERKITRHSGGFLRRLPEETEKLLLKESISPIPLHKSLILLDEIRACCEEPFSSHEMIALSKALVFSISNLHFGPEVGVRRVKKQDASVIEYWMEEIRAIASDINNQSPSTAISVVYNADAREMAGVLKPNSIDAVFTSPPYPNEKDYTRTTRLESVLLGYLNNKDDLRRLKKGLLRSNTRNVYKGDTDDAWVSHHQEIQSIANTIENRRIELNKTSGFEKMYGRVTKLYFGGMARHFADLRQFLKPGASLGYVVGDQASYLRVMIKTGELLAEIAESLGYEVVGIDLFRTRFATATKRDMREEVVILKWPG